MKSKSIELLAFDRNHELQYQGKCKLKIDKLSKMLLVEPVNEEYKMISAMFKWDFLMNKNILFVIGEHELNDFALVFDKEKRCKKVYDNIVKNKPQNEDQKEMLHQHFLLPISNKISQKNDTAVKLKNLMVKWINKHEEKAKEEYLNILKENHLFDEKTKSGHNLRKRRCPEDDGVPGYCDDKKLQRKQKIFAKMQQKIFQNRSLYKFVNVKSTFAQLRWRLQKRLLIFTNSEKTFCFQFSCNNKMSLYTCVGCKAQGKSIKAIPSKDGNGMECIKMEDKKHICTPMPYVSENYVEMKIYKKPGYEVLENCNTASGKILVLFDKSERSKCWEFRFDNSKNLFVCRQCTILAKLWNENSEDECVELTNVDHKCPYVPYEPKKFHQFKEFVLSPEFEVQTYTKNGEEKKRLIIFDKNDRNFCNIYHAFQIYFNCTGCRRKGSVVSAKLLQNSDGVDYVLLSSAKHVCDLLSYSDYSKKDEIVIRPPDFELMKNTSTGVKKIFIFDSNNRNLCYTFSHKKGTHNIYYCLGCNDVRYNKRSNKQKRSDAVTAKLCKDKDGEEIVRLNGSKHICKPTKYEPEKYAKKEVQKCYDYFFFRRTASTNSINVGIYHPEDKSMCYQLNYNKNYSYFVCNECKKKGKTLFTRNIKDENEKEYFNHDYKKHVCQPIKVSTIRGPAFLALNREELNLEKKKMIVKEIVKNERETNAAKVISSSDFITVSESSDDNITAVIVFTTPARGECYEFSFHKVSKLFRCRGCKIFNKFLWVKLLKDKSDQEYLQQSHQEHVCKSRKFIKEKYEPKNIITNELFEFHPNTKAVANKKLVVFTSEKKDFVYEFYEKRKDSFNCFACTRLKHTLTLKLHKVKNDQPFFECGLKEHVCHPRKYDPAKFVYLKPKVYSNNQFAFCDGNNGEKDKYLVIFTSAKKDFVYVYYFSPPNRYICVKCSNKKDKKNYVVARVIESQDGSKSIELGKNEHVCEPRKYDSKNMTFKE